MQAVIADGSGRVRVVTRPRPVPKRGEVLVRVAAAAVNRADLLQAQGKYPPPAGASDVLGLEVAGYLQDDTPVCALLTHGAFAEYAAVPQSAILPFPADVAAAMPLTHLAAIPEAFLAAHHILFQIGNFAPGETVLVHAAASGVGTSVIQLAATVPGSKIIASASTIEKLKFCRTLGAHALVNYTQESLVDAAHKLTNGHGVDLVLDCVGASMFKENVRALRTDGRWVMYGLLSGAKSPELGLAGIVSKRLALTGTTLRSRDSEYRAALIKTFVSRFGKEFTADGSLHVVVDKIYPGLSSVQTALDYMKSNASIGKLVIDVESR